MKDLLLKAGINDFELHDFLNKGRLRKVPANYNLLQEGAYCNSWIYIKKGVTRHYITTSEGKEHTKNFTTENSFVFTSISSYLSKKPTIIEFQSLTKCEFIEWDQYTFDEYLKNSKWNNFYHLLINDLIIKKEYKELSLLTNSAKERYDFFLKSKGFLLNIIPHYHIASYLSMSAETLSRIRKE